MSLFAVIDTETTWQDRVMSIGIVLADETDFRPAERRYYILDPERREGGMYSDRMEMDVGCPIFLCSRRKALSHIRQWLEANEVDALFAYNAVFDFRHLPELSDFAWFDILKLAAYRQYNPAIPYWAECCRTGRLKRDYGVEPILRLLSGNRSFQERHNALLDAVDELSIMRLLGHDLCDYTHARVN